MASSAGSSRDTTGAPPPLAVSAPSNNAPSNTGAPADTSQLDKLCEKALAAGASGRYALSATFYQRAADEALRLHGETFVCTFLRLKRVVVVLCQSRLEGVTSAETAALRAEAWALVSSALPLIVRRMDANTMLPGRGTALELAFFKRFLTMQRIKWATLSTRDLPLTCCWSLLRLVLRTRRPLFCAWWTACCQPHEACQKSGFFKRKFLQPTWSVQLLVNYRQRTRHSLPCYAQDGRLRR